MRRQLRISRIKRPRTTLLAILMLAGVYSSIGVWAESHIDHATKTTSISGENFLQPVVKRLTHALVGEVYVPMTNIAANVAEA